jgi:hypothetical protein
MDSEKRYRDVSLSFDTMCTLTKYLTISQLNWRDLNRLPVQGAHIYQSER